MKKETKPCYYKLKSSILGLLDSLLTKYYDECKNNGFELHSLDNTPEVKAMFAAQPPHKNFSKERILKHFMWWAAKLVHPMDLMHILDFHSNKVKTKLNQEGK
jgi:hypothetical protein